MKRFWRSATAMLLATCLLLSVCGNGIAVFAQQQKTTYYVSLGDSMTNGLGMLSGYDAHDSCGYMEIASDTYPARFSAWLAGYDGPISAGQSTYKGTNGTVKLTQLATSGMRSEDLHYILKYGQPGAYAGDDYMFTEVLKPNGRWNSAYAGGAEKVSAKFRDSIASADVISMAVGNANFGVYLAGMVQTATGLPGGDDENYDEFTLEAALANVDPELAATVLGVYNMILPVLCSSMPEELAETVGDRIGYVIVNYFLHYSAALDEIAVLNPDAEIIILGLFNTMSGYEAYVTYGGNEYYINLADIMKLILSPVNDYLAIMVAGKQRKADYADITFYYAETDKIQTLATTFTDAYKEDEDFFRQRFIVDISGMAFPMIGNEDMAEIELADVKAYEAAAENGIMGLASFAQKQYDKAFSSAVYLALEGALLNAMQEIPRVNLDEIMAYNDSGKGIEAYFGDLLSGVMGDYQQKVEVGTAAQINNAAKAFIAAQKGIGMNKVTQAMIDKALADTAQKQKIIDLAELYVTGDCLTAALAEDERISAVLSLYSHMMLASGMNAHPNRKGHETMTEAVIAAVEKGPLEHAYSYTYETTPNSYYLALGDATAYGTSANALAKKLASATVNPVGFANKTVNNQTAAELLAALQDLSGEIQKADLITLGFNGNQFMTFLVNQLKRVMGNKEPEAMDWEAHFGEESAAMVQKLLSKMQDVLTGSMGSGNVMGIDINKAMSVAIESYAYSYAVHLATVSKLTEGIHAINPDAQIVMVGMYNPMKGVVLNMEGNELDLGQYLQYLINLINVLYQSQAAGDGKFTYVKAPDVETGAKPTTYEMVPFLMELMMKGAGRYNPTANGYAYIAEQLNHALEVTVPSPDQHKHEYCDWYVFKAATGEEEGLKRRDCLHCDHYEELKLPMVTGPEKITSDIYKIGEVSVSKIAAGTTAAQFLQGLHEAEYVKIFKDGKEVSADTKIGTGMVVQLVVGNEVVQSLTAVVTGDVSGDGAITITDMLAVKSHVLNKSKLDGVYLTAGDTSGDGAISITDFIQIKAQILGKGSVAPQGA